MDTYVCRLLQYISLTKIPNVSSAVLKPGFKNIFAITRPQILTHNIVLVAKRKYFTTQ